MKYLVAALLWILAAAPANAVCPNPVVIKDGNGTSQNFSTTLDGFGNCAGFQQFPGVALTFGTAWISSTTAGGIGVGATQILMPAEGAPAIQVQVNISDTSLSTGAIAFDWSMDNTNWVQSSTALVLNGNGSLANSTNPFTLPTGVAGNSWFTILTNGFPYWRIRLASAITAASGKVTPIWNLNGTNPVFNGIINPLAAGNLVIGKVGVDQTTPGTTNLVQSSTDPCTFKTKVNQPFSTAAGTTQIISGVAATKIYICSFSLIAPTAVSVSLIEGSSASCGTSSQGGVMGQPLGTIGASSIGLPLAANGGLTIGNGAGTIASTATAANYLCLFQSGTAQLSGNLTYVQQ